MFRSKASSPVRKLFVIVVLVGSLCFAMDSQVAKADPHCCSFCDFANDECQAECDEIIWVCQGEHCAAEWDNCIQGCDSYFNGCENSCDPSC